MEIDAAKLIAFFQKGTPTVVGVRSEASGTDFPVALEHPGPGVAIFRSIKDIEDQYRKAPDRSRGTAKALTVDSFIALFNRHQDEHSAIFADIVDPDKPSLTAVFDYSENTANPRFGQHRLTHAFPLTEEWQAWRVNNLKGLSQADFADFIDDRIAEIGEASDHPDAEMVKSLLHGSYATAAHIHTLSRGLAVSASIAVKQAVSLDDGRISVQFEEGEHKGDDGKPIKVPNLFVLRLPIFVGGPAVPIIGRLRYKLAGGKIVWHYDLWQIRAVMRGALLQVLERVQMDTEAPVFEGFPEA